MISYGLNRIFRHAQSGAVNWNSRNNDPDLLFLEEANTGSIERSGDKGSKRLGRKISQYGHAGHGRSFDITGVRHRRVRRVSEQKGGVIFLLYSLDVCSRICDASEKGT